MNHCPLLFIIRKFADMVVVDLCEVKMRIKPSKTESDAQHVVQFLPHKQHNGFTLQRPISECCTGK